MEGRLGYGLPQGNECRSGEAPQHCSNEGSTVAGDVKGGDIFMTPYRKGNHLQANKKKIFAGWHDRGTYFVRNLVSAIARYLSANYEYFSAMKETPTSIALTPRSGDLWLDSGESVQIEVHQ